MNDDKKEDKILKSFCFSIPVELMKSNAVEGDEPEDSWKIRGIASTEDKDLQGEKLLQDGIDLSVIKSKRGLFNNNHSNQPEDILGEIDDAEVIELEGKKCLSVEGYLFKHQPRAQAYYNIMKSVRKGGNSRVHYSVEGKVVERDLNDSTKIKKAVISRVALTLDPINPYTFAELAKSLAAVQDPPQEPSQENTISQEDLFHSILDFTKSELEKAISAGYGDKAPSQKTGGEVTQKESLDKKPKKLRKNCKKSIEKAIVDAIIKTLEKGSN